MPASAPTINVKISAKADELSASIAKVRKELASLPALTEQVNRKIGAKKSKSPFDALWKQFEKPYKGAGKLYGGGLGAVTSTIRNVPGLGALAGVASIAVSAS